jgi:hypothetical protein
MASTLVKLFELEIYFSCGPTLEMAWVIIEINLVSEEALQAFV